MQRHVEIDGVEIKLGQHHAVQGEWIGQHEILQQLLACWLVVNEKDLAAHAAVGRSPGNGKDGTGNGRLRRVREQELYIYQCTADTRPEDC
jgi:MoxR-like ATPase